MCANGKTCPAKALRCATMAQVRSSRTRAASVAGCGNESTSVKTSKAERRLLFKHEGFAKEAARAQHAGAGKRSWMNQRHPHFPPRANLPRESETRPRWRG